MTYHIVHICRGRRTYGRDRNIVYWTSIASIKPAVHWSFGCFLYYRNCYTLFAPTDQSSVVGSGMVH
jgi:hypothetical protein